MRRFNGIRTLALFFFPLISVEMSISLNPGSDTLFPSFLLAPRSSQE